MGSHSSKPSANESAGASKAFDADVNGDPRSPTPEITRTPLHNKNSSKHNITKNVDLRKTFEGTEVSEKLIHNNPILSAVIKSHLQSYDPRSPTQDFERTPIVISKNDLDEKLIGHLQDNDFGSPCLDRTGEDTELVNEKVISELIVPKNLCNGFFDMTLDDSLKQSEVPLGSSTASSESIVKDNISNSGEGKTQLLETNFDYIESNENDENDYKCLSENSNGNEIKTSCFKILDNDPRSPSIGIERTPIVVSNIDENKDGNVEEMSDDTLIKVLQSTNLELRQTSVVDKNPDGLLIYEDEVPQLSDTPKKLKPDIISVSTSKTTGNGGSRTPLSCMKNKTDSVHVRSKSANTLDSKIQNGASIKSVRRASHIPRLKSLSKPALIVPSTGTFAINAISGDCENTPPQSHRDRWDKDSSIVL